MPERRYAPINGRFTAEMLRQDATFTGSLSFNSDISMDTADIKFTSARGIYAEVASGAVNLDLDAIDLAGAGTSTIRMHRSTDTSGFADTAFYRGDGTATLNARIRYDNTANEGLIEMLQGGKIKAYSSGNSKSLDLYHNGTDAFLDVGGATTHYRFNTSGDATGDILALNGMGIRAYDSESNDSIKMRHNGTHGIIELANKADGKGIVIAPNTSPNRTMFFTEQILVASEDTGTITLPTGRDAGFVFIVASSTTTAEGSAGAFFYWDTGTMIDMGGTGANWVLGGGTNPNTASRHNVWRSATNVLSIKNRIGPARYYSVYIFTGD